MSLHVLWVTRTHPLTNFSGTCHGSDFGPPTHAKVYERENLRCNLCLEVFTAEPPEGVGLEKYDATAGSMIALLKYGTGMPFHWLGRLQQSLGIPLPASTQWEIVAEIADEIKPVYEELIRQAAQGEVLHNDDTSMTVLALNGRKVPREKGERTGGNASSPAIQFAA